MASRIPTTTPELLAMQLEQRATVILSMTANWSASQAMVELHPGGPSGQNTIQHLTEVTRTTLSALDLELPFHGPGESWPEWRARFESVSARLAEQVRNLTGTCLAKEPAIEILPEFKESLSTRHGFLMGHVFHLGYHSGQLGSIAAILSHSRPKKS